MRGDDDRRSEAIERREQVEQPRRHLGVDVSGRLVGHEQLGLADHRAGDRHALLLAPGQRRRPGAGAVGKADPGEHLAHRPLDFGIAPPGYAQRQGHIVECRKVRDQPEVLENDADPPAEGGKQLARGVAELLVEQADAPARRPLGEVEQFQQRRLARARRPGEEIEAAAREPEIEVAQHFGIGAVAQPDAIEFDYGRQLAPPMSLKLVACGRRLANPPAFLFTLGPLPA